MVREQKVAGARGPGWVVCRSGMHRVPRNQIAVHYEPGFGLCGQCIIRRCGCVADYWTKGKALRVD